MKRLILVALLCLALCAAQAAYAGGESSFLSPTDGSFSIAKNVKHPPGQPPGQAPGKAPGQPNRKAQGQLNCNVAQTNCSNSCKQLHGPARNNCYNQCNAAYVTCTNRNNAGQ